MTGMPYKTGAVAATAERILETLKMAGDGRSVKELCGHLDLSSMAVRRQLALLESRHLVLAETMKKKIGRPEYRWFLTSKGHESFSRRYSEMAIDLLVQLRTKDGKSKLNDLFVGRKDEQVRAFRGRLAGRTLEARVHEVTRFLCEDGYMAKWEKVGPDRYLIKEMNCSVERIARKFPQACICEEAFLSEVLGAKVTRQRHILRSDHYCSYLIEA